jgi:AraC-like DNA-binding protein
MEQEERSRRLRGPGFFAATTEAAPPRERFDFWSSLFSGVRMAPLPRPVGLYAARAAGCNGDDGVVFTDLACDPTATSYSDNDNDHMRLSVVVSGTVQVTEGHDRRTVVSAGPGMHMFDSARAAAVDSPTGYRAFHLTLPRALVFKAMGGDPMAGRQSLRSLPETPLSMVLRSQLEAMSRHGPRLDAEEAAAVMRSLSDLAETYLRRFDRRFQDEVESPADDALFVSVCRYIDLWKEDAKLTAGAVAAAAGCSRARLYRLFERRGVTIGEHIREVRLNHGRALLRDPAISIGDVSFRCGYGDLSAFGKAFRRRFGMSPRDWRMAIV